MQTLWGYEVNQKLSTLLKISSSLFFYTYMCRVGAYMVTCAKFNPTGVICLPVFAFPSSRGLYEAKKKK